jgi:YD repeat-containing protein
LTGWQLWVCGISPTAFQQLGGSEMSTEQEESAPRGPVHFVRNEEGRRVPIEDPFCRITTYEYFLDEPMIETTDASGRRPRNMAGSRQRRKRKN